MSNKIRLAAAALTLSVAGLAGIAVKEGYTDHAVIPIPGDVPTIGHGTTRYEDGSPVQINDKLDKPRALQLLRHDAKRFEVRFQQCAPYPMTQNEFDSFVDLAYNVGPEAICRSSIPGKLKSGQYEAACKTILDFKWATGKDCSIPANKCMGVWKRRLEMYEHCMR